MSENIYLKQYEATPTNTGNGQLTHQINVGNPTENTMSHRSLSGSEVTTYISGAKVVELIQDRVSVLPDNVYTVPEDGDVLFSLLESPTNYNIWNENITLNSSTHPLITLNGGSGTHIYSRKNGDLTIIGDGLEIYGAGEANGKNLYFHGVTKLSADLLISGTGYFNIYFDSIDSNGSTITNSNVGCNIYVKNSNVNFSAVTNLSYLDWEAEGSDVKLEDDSSLTQSGTNRQVFKDSSAHEGRYHETKLEPYNTAGKDFFTETIGINGFVGGEYVDGDIMYQRKVADQAGVGSAFSREGYVKEFLNVTNLTRQTDYLGHNAFQSEPEPWGSAYKATQTGIVTEYTNGNIGGRCINGYIDSLAVWHHSEAGYVYREEFDKSTGLTTVYKSSASGAIDAEVSTWRKFFERDKLGNTAEDGASIPPNISETVRQHFSESDNSVFSVSGFKLRCKNVFVNSSGSLVRINEANEAIVEQISTAKYQRLTAPSGSGTITFVSVFDQDLANGNINIKSGGTYTATL